jgi:hypothetical protein
MMYNRPITWKTLKDTDTIYHSSHMGWMVIRWESIGGQPILFEEHEKREANVFLGNLYIMQVIS